MQTNIALFKAIRITVTLWALMLVINSGSLFCQTIEERFDAGVELYLSTWKKYLRNGAINRMDPNNPGRFTGINYSSNQIEEVFVHLDLLFQVAQLYRYGDYHDHNPATHPLDWKDYQNDTIKDFIISSLNYLDHAYSDTILGVFPIIGPITASRNSFSSLGKLEQGWILVQVQRSQDLGTELTHN